MSKRKHAIDDFAELADFLKQARTVQQGTAQTIVQIDKVHAKIGGNPEASSEYMSKKLRGLYKTAVENAQIEADLLTAALRATSSALNQRVEADPNSSRKRKRKSSVINSLHSSLPIWPDRYPPPLCGSVPAEAGHTITPGHQVAAFIDKSSGDDAYESWILASVVRIKKDGSYLIEDVMEASDAKSRERHTVAQSKLVSLPHWEPLPGLREAYFAEGLEVLAMYPQTTCFYAAVVHRAPNQESRGYQMHFHDDDFEDGRIRYQEVPVRFVVAKPS